MKYFVQYDPITGKVKGRLNLNYDDRNSASWPHILEITVDEYQAKPEIFKKVDLETMTLVDK